MKVKCTVDGKEIDLSDVWYHHHSNPSSRRVVVPYVVKLSLEEQAVIRVMERIAGAQLAHREEFLKAAIKLDKSSFNLIRYIQDGMERTNNGIDWVFYNIKTLSIENNQLVITGEAARGED